MPTASVPRAVARCRGADDRDWIGLRGITSFWPLLLVAVVGTLNPSSGDVSVFLPLEHSVLARVVDDRQRTAVFARYSLVGALVGALGALVSGLPEILATAMRVSVQSAYQSMFLLYAALGAGSALIYRKLPSGIAAEAEAPAAPLAESKRHRVHARGVVQPRRIRRGFIVQSLLALWLFESISFRWPWPDHLLLDRRAFGVLLSGCNAHRPSDRSRQHDGVHASAVQRAPVARAVRAVALLAIALCLREARVANGCPDAELLRNGVVAPNERAAAREHHVGSRKLGPAVSPLAAGYLWHVDLRLAADHRGRRQDRLRSPAARDFPDGAAAGGSRAAAVIAR